MWSSSYLPSLEFSEAKSRGNAPMNLKAICSHYPFRARLNSMEPQENKYLVPLSVIVAGVLIAGAVLYSRKPQDQGPPQPKGLTSVDIVSIAEKSIPANAKKDLKNCLDQREFKDRV